MRAWAVCAATAATVVLAVPIASAAALPEEFSDSFGIMGWCADEDHSGGPYEDPNGGPPVDTLSVIPFAGSIRDLPVDSFISTFELQTVSPSGQTLVYAGPLLPDAIFQGVIGINEGGEYPITSFTVMFESADGETTSTTIDPSTFPDGGVMAVTFDGSEPCDATVVEPGTVIEVEAEPEEPTEEPTDDPTEVPTGDATEVPTDDATDDATEAPDDETEAAPQPEDDDTDTGRTFPWPVMVITGLAIFAAGLALFAGGGAGPCDELKRRWDEARDDCEEAEERRRRTREELTDAHDDRATAEDALANHDAEYPPNAMPGGSSITDPRTGRTVTSTDLWISQQWAAKAWEDYRDAPSSERAQRTEEAWEDGPPEDWADAQRDELEEARTRRDELEKELDGKREAEARAEEAAEEAAAAADEACAAADAARRAYLDCIDAADGASAGDQGEGETAGGPGTGPSGPASVVEPDEGGPCKDGEERVTTLATFGPRDVVADFSIIATPHGMHGAQDGGQLSIELGVLAAQLDAVFAALSARGALKDLKAGETGSAALGTAGMATGAATSVTDLVGQVLSFTAKLGSKVAGSVDRWMGDIELFHVRSPVFVRRVEASWVQVERCVAGTWECQRELRLSRGPLRRTQLFGEMDVVAPGLKAELQRRARGLQARVRSDLEAVRDFVGLHSEGPC